MIRRARVYVAGPISKGDVAVNVKRGVRAGLGLLAAGYAPFIPHLSAYAYDPGDTSHLIGTDVYEQWLELDYSFIRACDAMLRLDGESAGADREVAFARSLGIPVFFTETELQRGLDPLVAV